MTYSISCVLLIPAMHQQAINQVAEAVGYGPGNLSVELVHADGSTWYGCHTWCIQGFLDQMANPPEEVSLIDGSTEALEALIVSSEEGGESVQHWERALSLYGLSVVQPLTT